VARPQLLVLDEPTSALDVHTERAIRETVQSLCGQATVVIVAHRLSTVNVCDRLLVMQDGAVVADGPPSALAADDPYYRDALALSSLRT
jgi:ATP-binding cassette subfamily B protein